MSDTFVLKSEIRQGLGTKDSAQARGQGKIPAVIYGHKQDPVNILLNSHDFVEALHHGHRVFEVDLGSKKEQTLLKDLQYDHLGKSVIHADLVRVDLTETVQVEVPIELKGTAVGTTHGGIIDELMTELEIECVVTAIPESIEVSIKNIDIGQSLHASDIELPEGVKMLTPEDAVILTCHEVKVAAEPEEGEETAEQESAEPEVITEKKEESEESKE